MHRSQHRSESRSRSLRHRFFQPLVLLLLAALAFLTAGSAAADPWIHVKVESRADETVTVNLPVSLVRAAAAMIPAEAQEDVTIELERDLELDWHELRAFWNEVREAPEATFVTVETPREHVVVRKEGDFVLVNTEESWEDGAEVDVKIPVQVVDALLSGPEGTFDFQAAIDALVAYGPEQIITVKDGQDRVRIWIDDVAPAD